MSHYSSLITHCSLLIALGSLLITPARARTASDTWGQVAKTIVVHPGTDVPVWKGVNRSLITNGPMTMTPVGDGTHEAVIGLMRGQVYNYLFFATAGFPAQGGLVAFNEYFDVIPPVGFIRASTNGKTTTDTTSARYQPVAFDARRVLTVPHSLNPGDTLWVFNNFGETPGLVTGFNAFPEGDTQVRLVWTGVFGFWGTGGEPMKSADVLAGGQFLIYRSNTSETGPFTQIATVDGRFSTWLDMNLAVDTYWYVIRARDAYLGAATATDSFPRLTGDSTAPGRRARPRAPIAAFFIVRDGSWDVIHRQHGVAYFSFPNDPPWGPKIPVTMAQVVVRGNQKKD